MLINSHKDIFRYISGHVVIDENYNDRAENVTRFSFTLSLGVFSVSSVYREDYSIPNKPVESAKNWFVILF